MADHQNHSFLFQDLEDPEQDFFIESLEMFSTKVWRRPKQEKKYRYDIAMLVDPDEKMPPSDASALKRFHRAANRLGMNLETISPDDLSRLGNLMVCLFAPPPTSVTTPIASRKPLRRWA